MINVFCGRPASEARIMVKGSGDKNLCNDCIYVVSIIANQAMFSIDHTCVTAFIDESIHSVAWDEQGHKGKAGIYSYIICWGNLSSESQITDKRVITDGVDYTGENEHIERITETAVGRKAVSNL